MARALVLAVAVLVAAASLAVAPARAASFVSVSGHQLTLDGQPFYFTGGNAHWLADTGSSDRGKIDALFGAAQSIGMRVVRAWAFSPAAASGGYDFSLLDYAVESAWRHGLRLVLALGNTWKAYGGPELFLGDAAAGKTISDFYESEDARRRYRAHVERVTSHVNPLTGRAYKDDPTIMAYDVINEPRCPGCDGGQLAARDSWLDEMIAAARASAPNQLILTGSEGFFGPGSPYVSKNPGAGAACEGDDFEEDAKKASAATAHLYWRTVEGTPDRAWAKVGFDDYVPFLAARIDLLEQVAGGSLARPFIIEEFGLTERFFDKSQAAAAAAVVLDRLVRSKQSGGALAGALIWGLLPPGSGASNAAGYNVVLDGGAAPSNVGLGSAGVFVGGGGGANGASSSHNASSTTGARRRRHLRLSRRRLSEGEDIRAEDTLDAFRRGPQRKQCADARASGWTFPYDFGRATGVSAEAVKAAAGGASMSSLFKEAASKL
jgi:mannan endo-1,4-beta-mannosidase